MASGSHLKERWVRLFYKKGATVQATIETEYLIEAQTKENYILLVTRGYEFTTYPSFMRVMLNVLGLKYIGGNCMK